MISAGDTLARRYRVVRPIASGGMSVIWHAVDIRLERDIAVKVATESASPGEAEAQPLAAEARYVARVLHPGAIDVYDYGETVTTGGRVVPFAVLPLLDGDLLASRIAGRRLPWRDAVSIGAAIADALAEAHRAGVVHGDVTPENIMLTRHGPRLIDFGLATSSGSSGVGYAGTPPYVAPERVAGRASAPADDVYSLGVVLYQSLAGYRPFPEITWDDIEAATRHHPRPIPPVPHDPGPVPGEVEQLVRACLGNAGQRPSAGDLAADLHHIMRRSTNEPRPGRAAAAWCAAALAVTAALVAGAVTLAADDPAQSEVDAAPTFIIDTSIAPPPDPSPTPVTRTQAFDTMHELLADGVADGTVRPDVSLDISQVAENITWSQDPADVEQSVDTLRQKLDDRVREGGLSREVWRRLHEQLADLAARVP